MDPLTGCLIAILASHHVLAGFHSPIDLAEEMNSSAVAARGEGSMRKLRQTRRNENEAGWKFNAGQVGAIFKSKWSDF